MALLSGACLYPVTDKYRHDPWALKKYMEKNAVSVTTFPPSYLHLFDKDEISRLLGCPSDREKQSHWVLHAAESEEADLDAQLASILSLVSRTT